MYFVDRDKIEQTLIYMEKQINFLENQSSLKSEVQILAFERSAHVLIEAILDVGNAMIDGFIMRDPGSYEDIIDILDDESVITKDMIEPLKKIVGSRKQLVQQYVDVNHEEISAIFTKSLPVLNQFPLCVRNYLLNELGPVSAFRK